MVLLLLMLISAPLSAGDYAWLPAGSRIETLQHRVPPPPGFERSSEKTGSFGDWLRNLPLKPASAPVLLYDGTLKRRQDVHQAVVDIDTGTRDLQQCADAVIRLRAEYLFASGRANEIAFRFTNGSPARFQRWSEGFRPSVSGNHVQWNKSAAPDSSYESFRRYLDIVFLYAGSYSLSRELTRVETRSIRSGDVFIHGGFPGHAVLVVDMAVRASTGEKAFLLAQSYMPAQNIHILKNPNDGEPGPWYLLHQDGKLVTPEWVFDWTELMRFP